MHHRLGLSFVPMKIPRLGPIADGLIHDAEIPLSWQVISNLPGADACLKFHESNRQVLKLLLKEGAAQDSDVIPDLIAREMNRLESKLDLLITLVGALLSKETETPASRKVMLGSDGLQILLDSSSDKDALLAELPVIPSADYVPGSSSSDCLVKVSMFLDAHFPQPLILFARVEIVHQTGVGSLIVATFLKKDPEVQDLLEKFIFQQHRRVIAASRTEYKEH